MTPATAPQTAASQTLARCREVVQPALVEAVERLHPWLADMAAHSLGWTRTPGGFVPGSRGKGVRQALAVLCAEAAGAPAECAVAGAVAVELVHTFSLVHDDIMDGDETRRQRESTWKAYGAGPAVLAGDAMCALAAQLLCDSPAAQGGAAVRHLAHALNDMARGQADDLCFEFRSWTGPDAVGMHEYRSMAERKTGALLGCATGLGAVLAGAPAATVAGLTRAGRHLGVAFQAVDDLLGIWGDPQDTGKPVYSDLRRLKKTYPVLAALASDTPAARQLMGILASGGTPDDAGARQAADLIEEAGGRSATRSEAQRHLDRAHDCLTALDLEPTACDEIRALLPFLIHRRA
ncbi:MULTISPECIES: polyprenyl synthetase family protein [Streptomyces]|uniref:Polyprenyl synthetase family protein n=1 Tax=Streptomyces siderophoricus TaxID=2802281 RepID=A0ABS1MSB7_9ACTN|nr:polyprenyl synthetase family protein [Streptomyces sp. 9-7]MBL1090677.1 polyprenyl synthetase family protein [Streptomyces sp. 9-7]